MKMCVLRFCFCGVTLASFFVPLEATCYSAQPQGVRIERPSPDGGPTKVSTAMFIIDLDDIDGAAQSFTANVFYRMQWKDPRLADETGRRRTYDLGDVWNPRIQITNQQRVWKSMPDVIDVEPDGTATLRQRYVGMFSQPLNLAEFPLDEHTFQIHLVSAGHGPDEVLFIAEEEEFTSGIAPQLSIADWAIQSWVAEPRAYAPIPGTAVPGFIFEFRAERYVGYYIWKVILPAVLIVMMSWSVFWIDPTNAGTQIGVATSSMLTLIAYRFMMGNFVPRLPYMTRLDYFILGSTVLVFLTLAQVVLTAALVRSDRKSLAIKVDHTARVLFPASFAIVLVLSFFV